MCFLIQGLSQLNEVAAAVNGRPVREEFLNFKDLNEKNSSVYKRMETDGKTFPGSFSLVTIEQNKENLILPMRYRLRPHDSQEEVPSKYNVFNARRDSLLTRKTWAPLVGKNHGIFVMKKFYEWVRSGSSENSKRKLIGIYPTKNDLMYVPCLYDRWRDPVSGEYFYSFAVLTDGPPDEILEAGHDRCPIHLDKNHISDWLHTSKRKSFKEWDSILDHKSDEYFEHVEDYKIERKKKAQDDKQLRLI